jgi:hypothetical protein
MILYLLAKWKLARVRWRLLSAAVVLSLSAADAIRGRWVWLQLRLWRDGVNLAERANALLARLGDRPRGRWQGEPNAIQQWTERDPHRSPQWWAAHAPRKAGR